MWPGRLTLNSEGKTMRSFLYSLLAISILFLVSCQGGGNKATVVYFTEQEPSTEPYETRMFVTRDYLRIDDGKDSSGYILLDRKKQIINSVSMDEQRILVIRKLATGIGKDSTLVHEARLQNDQPPKVGGKTVRHYQLVTNKKKCYELFAAKDLLPEAVKALQEYRRILAGEHARTAASMPQELRSDCDFANHVAAPDRHLHLGFPVLTIDMTGRQRQLKDFKKNQAVSTELFRLPAGFKSFGIQPGAEGAS